MSNRTVLELLTLPITDTNMSQEIARLDEGAAAGATLLAALLMKRLIFGGTQPFVCGDVMLLRAPTLPFNRAWDARFSAAQPDEAAALAAYIRRATDDPLLREAVELSSPSLSGLIDKVSASKELPQLKALRRGALAIAGYKLRMAGRATPFGLMAGVAAESVTIHLRRLLREGAAARRRRKIASEWLLSLPL